MARRRLEDLAAAMYAEAQEWGKTAIRLHGRWYMRLELSFAGEWRLLIVNLFRVPDEETIAEVRAAFGVPDDARQEVDLFQQVIIRWRPSRGGRA